MSILFINTNNENNRFEFDNCLSGGKNRLRNWIWNWNWNNEYEKSIVSLNLTNKL